MHTGQSLGGCYIPPLSLKWDATFGSDEDDANPPVVGSDGTIYFTGNVGSKVCVYAVDGDTGSEKWTYQSKGDGIRQLSIGIDGTIYTAIEGNFLALDSNTGAPKYIPPLTMTSGSAAIGYNGLLYFSSQDQDIMAVDGHSGEVRWVYKQGLINGDITDVAIDLDDTIYFGVRAAEYSGYDGTLYALNGLTGDFKWSVNIPADVKDITSTTPVLDPSYHIIFIGYNEKMFAFNTSANGLQIWVYVTESDKDIRVSNPAVGKNGIVYFGADNGMFYALNATNGHVKWINKDVGSSVASPSIGSDGTIYIGSHDTFLYALDGETGNVLWSYNIVGTAKAWPAIGSDGSVYICSSHYQDGYYQTTYIFAFNGTDVNNAWISNAI